jgi:hypothetical protein
LSATAPWFQTTGVRPVSATARAESLPYGPSTNWHPRSTSSVWRCAARGGWLRSSSTTSRVPALPAQSSSPACTFAPWTAYRPAPARARLRVPRDRLERPTVRRARLLAAATEASTPERSAAPANEPRPQLRSINRPPACGAQRTEDRRTQDSSPPNRDDRWAGLPPARRRSLPSRRRRTKPAGRGPVPLRAASCAQPRPTSIFASRCLSTEAQLEQAEGASPMT